MFGGLSFLVNGNMCRGVSRENLVVCVGPDQYEKVLAKLREVDAHLRENENDFDPDTGAEGGSQRLYRREPSIRLSVQNDIDSQWAGCAERLVTGPLEGNLGSRR